MIYSNVPHILYYYCVIQCEVPLCMPVLARLRTGDNSDLGRSLCTETDIERLGSARKIKEINTAMHKENRKNKDTIKPTRKVTC